MRIEHEAPTPCLFFIGSFEAFLISNFLKREIDLSSPEILFFDTYLILYCEIMYTNTVKDNNQHLFIASNVINLYSSYTCRSLVAIFRRFG